MQQKCIYFILMAVMLFLMVSCGSNTNVQPDKCKDVICQNGGNCVDGVCNCPAGYSGTNCEIAPDPCVGVVCQNGGTCVAGYCDCPSPYTGGNCSQISKPIAVYLKQVKITNYASNFVSGRKIMPCFEKVNGAQLYCTDQTAYVGTPTVFTPTGNINLVFPYPYDPTETGYPTLLLYVSDGTYLNLVGDKDLLPQSEGMNGGFDASFKEVTTVIIAGYTLELTYQYYW